METTSCSNKEITESAVAKDASISTSTPDNAAETLESLALSEPKTSLESRYEYASDEAKQRWMKESRMRIVNYDFGYPVLVSDENGNYVTVDDTTSTSPDEATPSAILPEILSGIDTLYLHKLVNSPSAVDGTGVFAAAPITANSMIGLYMGRVYADEDWEKQESPGQFVFAINDGANGVILDGEVGENRNELQYINHSCDPSAVMTEVYHRGCWHVVVIAKRDIAIGEEVTHNYALVTEDEESEDAKIACRCGSDNCQGTLFRVVDW